MTAGPAAPRGLLAVVPMKPIASAKSRLGEVLSGAQREAIACRLLTVVVAAAKQCAAINDVLVVGGDPAVRDAALPLGARWEEDARASLNAALESAFAAWFSSGGEAALFLPADLPLVTPAELARLASMSSQHRNIVLCPAARDGGTNAIILPRQARIPFMLGHDSYRKHLAEAARLGHPVVPYFSRALGLDVDTPADLAAWRAQRPTDFIGDAWDLAPLSVDKLFREAERGRRG